MWFNAYNLTEIKKINLPRRAKVVKIPVPNFGLEKTDTI